jgi:hypothetical protein
MKYTVIQKIRGELCPVSLRAWQVRSWHLAWLQLPRRQ